MSEHAPYAWFTPAGFGSALLGLALATYAFTPPRTYFVEFVGLAILGFVLMFGGIVLAGWARATSGRRRRPARSVPVEDASKRPEPPAEAPATTPRRGLGLSLLKRRSAPPVRERVSVHCPKCATGFDAEGVRPIALTCPSCGHVGAAK